MHQLNDALPGSYVPVRVILGALGRFKNAVACFQPPSLFIGKVWVPVMLIGMHIGILMSRHGVPQDFCSPLSQSLWNDLADPVFNGVGLAGFKSRVNAFFTGMSCSIPTIVYYYFFLSLLSVYRLVLWGWGLRTDGCV